MLKLITVPLGYSAHEAICKEVDQQSDAVLVLPSKLLEQRLKLGRKINTTSKDALVKQLLFANGWNKTLLGRGAQELVVEDVVKYVVEQRVEELKKIDSVGKSFHYFAALVNKPGFIKAMTSFMGQLRRGGTNVTDLRGVLAKWLDNIDDTEMKFPRTELQKQKDEDVWLAYALYENLLDQNGWTDLEGTYLDAIKILDANKNLQLPYKKIYFCNFYSFNSLEIELMQKLSDYCDIVVVLDYDTKHSEDIFEAGKNTYQDLVAFRQCSEGSIDLQQLPIAKQAQELAANLYIGKVKEEINSLHAYKFLNSEEELRWVLTDVKQKLYTTAPQEIALVFKNLENTQGLERIASEYGIPVNINRTAELAAQPLSEFIELIFASGNYDRSGAQAYSSLLKHGLGNMLFTSDNKLLAQLQKNTYFPTQSVLVEALAEKGFVATGLLEKINALIIKINKSRNIAAYLEATDELLSSLDLQRTLGQAYKENKLQLRDLQSTLGAFSQIKAAKEKLQHDYEICGHLQENISLEKWLQLWKQYLQGQELVLKAGNRKGVVITEVSRLPGTTFKELYILGLREGEFPSIRNESWIYGDAERKSMKLEGGLNISTTAQEYAEDRYFFCNAVCSWKNSLTLTCSLEDGKSKSSYFDLLGRFLPNGLELQEAPAKAIASTEEWFRLGKKCDEVELQKFLGKEVLEASQADINRLDNNGLNEYNGMLAGAGKELAHIPEAKEFSATALKEYVDCPFKYMLHRLWHLNELEEQDEEINALDKGSLLHKVVEIFWSRRLGKTLMEGEFSEQKEELKQIFNEEAERYDKVLQNNPLWKEQRSEFRPLLEDWLIASRKEQDKNIGLTAVAVEWKFGKKFGRPVQLKLNEQTTAYFTGSVDKIEYLQGKHYTVDYKTGSTPTGNAVLRGTDLQMPLYMLALEQNKLKPTDEKNCNPSGYAYYSFKDGRRKNSYAIGSDENGVYASPSGKQLNFEFPIKTEGYNKPDNLEEYFKDMYSNIYSNNFKKFTVDYLTYLLSEIDAGKFANLKPDINNCAKFCPYKNICRLKNLISVEEDEAWEENSN